MTTIARSVSPGGALLRASRVFAIPNPLPQPTSELSSTAVFSSDSATLPHPVDLSITTPQTSLHRGDWGFKRPLPLRSTTRTSTPFIRVKHIDTFEHITEFGSASDHTLNLQKWQEMGVPISTPVRPGSATNFPLEAHSGKTVFEEKYDTIAPADGRALGQDDVKWKFGGPWLGGMNEGEFNEYVLGEVRTKKFAFRQFLGEACAVETTQALRREASEHGHDPEQLSPALEASDITPEQLTKYIKSLRNDRIKLYQHIRTFLDLPPASTSFLPHEDAFLAMLQTPEKAPAPVEEFDSPYAKSGPPKTHPSAGLAYSRTSSYLFNHPIYGPQKDKAPVEARVVMPKAAATGSFSPVLGVGGFVTQTPAGANTSFNENRLGGRGSRVNGPLIPGISAVEPNKVGGSRLWVHPRYARIDPKGKVILTVTMGDPEAIAVHRDAVGEIPTEHKRPMKSLYNTTPNAASLSNSFGSGYGLGPKTEQRDDLKQVKKLEAMVQRR